MRSFFNQKKKRNQQQKIPVQEAPQTRNLTLSTSLVHISFPPFQVNTIDTGTAEEELEVLAVAERPAPPPVSLHAALSSLPKEEPAETREVTREEFLEVEVEEHKVDVGAEQTEMNKEEQVIVFSSFFKFNSMTFARRQAPEALSTMQNSLAEEEAAAEAGRASKGGSADGKDPALPGGGGGGGGGGGVKAKVADYGRIARSRSRESSPLKLAISDTGERDKKRRGSFADNSD